jgi:hypothetical protein
MRDHGVDANEKVEPLEEMTESRNIRRTDVARADLGQFDRPDAALERAERYARNSKMPQQCRRDGPSLVPTADFPNQADGKTSVLRKCSRGRRWWQRHVRCTHLEVVPPRLYGMRHLHNLDVDVEVDVRRTVMERKSNVDTGRSLNQRQKLALAPDCDVARNVAKRPHETEELNGVAETVVATHQHMFALQVFTAPDPLEVTRPDVLRAKRKHRQIAVIDRPGALEVACPHRLGPAARHSWSSG